MEHGGEEPKKDEWMEEDITLLITDRQKRKLETGKC
jgi:hypothetical protein